MKRVIFICIAGILLMIAGCLEKEEDLITEITNEEETPNEEEAPGMCVSILALTFKQTYLKYFQDDEVFLIKGVALNVDKHGREIKVIEDLKGNLEGKSSIFVWGMSSTSFCDNKGRQDLRLDDLTQYQENDTLVMFITNKVSENFNWDIERSNDYKTLGACFSILKFSNGYVTGTINNWSYDVPWKDLQEELQTLLNLEEKPSWWSIDYIPDSFIGAYRGIQKLKDRPDIPDFYNYYFFIKGLVLESYQEYGKKIQIIDDLKGNFPKEDTTFIACGYNNNSSTRTRFDDLKLYNSGDTLLMLLNQRIYPSWIPEDYETIGDYITLNSAFSVLQLSNNSVSGYINSCYKGEEVMSWYEFQELLNSM